MGSQSSPAWARAGIARMRASRKRSRGSKRISMKCLGCAKWTLERTLRGLSGGRIAPCYRKKRLALLKFGLSESPVRKSEAELVKVVRDGFCLGDEKRLHAFGA